MCCDVLVQEVSTEDALYALPTADIGPIEDVNMLVAHVKPQLAQPFVAFKDSTVSKGIQMETLMEDVALSVSSAVHTTISQCALHVFRVFNLTPSRAKVVKTVSNRLRKDHIAIANYHISARSCPTAQTGDSAPQRIAVESALALDPTEPVKFMSLETLLNVPVTKDLCNVPVTKTCRTLSADCNCRPVAILNEAWIC